MARIFVSYSRKDEGFARKLAGTLSNLGADIWIDVEDIPAGMKWSRAIQEGLDASEALIVIISPDSMASENVADEWQYYMDQRKPIIPILWQPAKVHFQLSRIQYIDFHTQGYDVAISQLHSELRRNDVHLQPITVDDDSIPLPPQEALPVRDSQMRPPRRPQAAAAPEAGGLPRGLLVGGAALALVIVAVIVIALLGGGGGTVASLSEADQTGTAVAAAQAAASDTPSPEPDTPTPEEAAPTATPAEPTEDPEETAVAAVPGVQATPLPAGASVDWQPLVQDFNGAPMVYVPAGCFMMGTADVTRGDPDERPAHEVCLSAFWIGQTEVTIGQYKACVEGGGCAEPRDTEFYSDPAHNEYPVINVTWAQAQAYARWLSGATGRAFSLPTEAQWEYAARGPQGRTYPWGETPPDDSCTRANVLDCRISWPLPVGPEERAAGASWVGALDMAGNVAEWVADWYDFHAYGDADEVSQDPTGPASGSERVLRGGAWNDEDYTSTTRSANRRGDTQPDRWRNYVGFRVAAAAE